MVTLPIVPIPGYADAVRKERAIRDKAFLGGLEIVCGVEVHPPTLRDLILLEHADNGYVKPLLFDDANEALAHALQFLYFCRPNFRLPVSPSFSFWRTWWQSVKDVRFINKITAGRNSEDILKEIKDWIAESFMDAPAGDSERVSSQSYASYPVYLIDLFAEAGLPFTEAEIMGMPLKKLWQHYRVAAKRKYGIPLTNPSDIVAVEGLNK